MMRSAPAVGTAAAADLPACCTGLAARASMAGPCTIIRGLAGRRLAGRAPGAALEAHRRLLEAVGAHRAQAGVGDELAALLVLVVAVHEGVFLGLPVEALELVGDVGLALLAEHALQVVGDPGGDQAVRHGPARAGPCSAR